MKKTSSIANLISNQRSAEYMPRRESGWAQRLGRKSVAEGGGEPNNGMGQGDFVQWPPKACFKDCRFELVQIWCCFDVNLNNCVD